MGQLHVEGVGTFTVDDAFGQLPADQQQALVAQMVAQVQGAAHAPPETPAKDTSLGGGLKIELTDGSSYYVKDVLSAVAAFWRHRFDPAPA